MKGIALLVGGFNPFENMLVKLDHVPQVGVKIKHIWKTTTYL